MTKENKEICLGNLYSLFTLNGNANCGTTFKNSLVNYYNIKACSLSYHLASFVFT